MGTRCRSSRQIQSKVKANSFLARKEDSKRNPTDSTQFTAAFSNDLNGYDLLPRGIPKLGSVEDRIGIYHVLRPNEMSHL